MEDIRRKYNLMVKFSKFTFSVSLDGTENNPHLNLAFFLRFMHYSWDSQIRKNTNFALKLGPMILFIFLKIILL